MLLPVVLSATFVQLLNVNRADRRSGHPVRLGRGPGAMRLILAGCPDDLGGQPLVDPQSSCARFLSRNCS
ncbi:hypothetical protein ACWEQ8_12915 [Streptomyces noursei]